MRAVRIVRPGGPEVLKLDRVEAPAPGPGDVVVEVRCTALNRADLLQRSGRYPPPDGTRADIPGLEYAGVIERAGEGVDETVVGSWVMGLVPGAAYAEQVATPIAETLPIPERLDFLGAAAVPEAFSTAWDGLFQANFHAGDSVLVHAAGSGVGTAALQLARAFGASQIFGTASAAKLEGIRERGLPLDHAIDYRSHSFRDVVRRETGGRGVDVVLDLVGGSYWEDNLGSLAERGRLVLIGLLGGVTARTNLGVLLRRRLRVVGTVMRSRSPAERREVASRVRDELLPLLADGRLEPVVDRVFPLEAASEAHRYMEDNRNLGKILLSVS